MIVIDSVTQLPSETEVETVSEGKTTTPLALRRVAAWTSFFRVVQLKLSASCVPLICTSHAGIDLAKSTAHYQAIKERGAGESMRFSASLGLLLSKLRIRDEDKNTIGSIVTILIDKSRFTREGTKIKAKMLFDGGLDPLLRTDWTGAGCRCVQEDGQAHRAA